MRFEIFNCAWKDPTVRENLCSKEEKALSRDSAFLYFSAFTLSFVAFAKMSHKTERESARKRNCVDKRQFFSMKNDFFFENSICFRNTQGSEMFNVDAFQQ